MIHSDLKVPKCILPFFVCFPTLWIYANKICVASTYLDRLSQSALWDT